MSFKSFSTQTSENKKSADAAKPAAADLKATAPKAPAAPAKS